MKTFYEYYKQLFIAKSINDPLLPILEDNLVGFIPLKIQQDYNIFRDHYLYINEIE